MNLFNKLSDFSKSETIALDTRDLEILVDVIQTGCAVYHRQIRDLDPRDGERKILQRQVKNIHRIRNKLSRSLEP